MDIPVYIHDILVQCYNCQGGSFEIFIELEARYIVGTYKKSWLMWFHITHHMIYQLGIFVTKII